MSIYTHLGLYIRKGCFSLFLLLFFLCGKSLAQTTLYMPTWGDTIFTLNSNYSYNLYNPDLGPYGAYQEIEDTITLVSSNGRPFTLRGSYSIGPNDIFAVYMGPSMDYPLLGFFQGSSTLDIYCYSGAVTLYYFHSPYSGDDWSMSYQICFPSIYNVRASQTNTSYTHISWQGGGSGSKRINYRSLDEGQQFLWNGILYSNPDSIHYNIAAGKKYVYYIRDYYSSIYDTSNHCNYPPHYFRTPKLLDCSSCDHYKNCLDYTKLSGTKQTTCYKGSSAWPDSTECMVDDGPNSSASQHTVHVDVNAFDANTNNQLRPIPLGDTAAVRLGNWNTGGGESILYEIHVDTNDYNLMMLKYAVVFLDPELEGDQQPRFSIRLTDENCLPVEPLCYSRDIFPKRNQLGWHVGATGQGHSYVWHDWWSMGIDLSPYHGKVLYLQLYTRDGAADGAAYAYFTLHCDRKQIDHLQQCGDTLANTFYAPEGFNYRWFNAANPDSTLSTQRMLSVIDSGLYRCWVSQTDCLDSSCGFYIDALASPRYPHALFEYIDSIGTCLFKVRFINRSFVSASPNDTIPLWTNEDCETAFWDFDNGETSTNYNAETVYRAAGTYYVKLISTIAGGDCADTLIIPITLQWTHPAPYISGVDSLCPAQTTTLTIHNTQSQKWLLPNTNHPPQSTSITLNPLQTQSSFMVNCAITDDNGCKDTLHYPITVLPVYNIHEYYTICQAQLDSGWTWRGHTSEWGSTGIYPYSGTTTYGCDSAVTLHLTIHPTYNVYNTFVYCDYDTLFPYPPNWFTPLVIYDTLGQHNYTFHNNITGCDSIVHLTLRKHTVPHDTIVAEVCRGFAFDTLDFHYTASQTLQVGLLTQTHTVQEHNTEAYQTGACDSTMTLLLMVNNQTDTTISVTINQNQQYYDFNGVRFDHNVIDTVIHLTNHWGCDSSIHFNFSINYNTETHLQQTICDDLLPYHWGILTFQSGGTQSIVYHRTNGADSTVYYTLNVNPTYDNHNYDTICDNQSAIFEGSSYTLVGVYPHPMTSSKGCDSIETLHLMVRLTHSTTIPDTTCSNSPYLFGETTLTTTGSYNHTFANIWGCDSVVTLQLVVNLVTDTVISETVLENNLPRIFNGQTFTGDVSATDIHLVNSKGCDSTIHYSLTVIWNDRTVVDSTVCANFLPLTWDGTIFDTTDFILPYSVVSVTKIDTLSNQLGADSVVVRTLHVNPVWDNEFYQTVCDDTSVAFAGITYTASGDYTHHLFTQQQCDSTVTLHLTVHAVTSSIVYDSIVENQLPYTFNNVTFSDSISNTAVVIDNSNQCDSIISFFLFVWRNEEVHVDSSLCQNETPFTWNGKVFTQTSVDSVVLHNIHGSDSTVWMHFTRRDNTASLLYDTVVENLLPHLWNGVTFTWSDTATVTLREADLFQGATLVNYVGCDSLTGMNLHVWRNRTAQVDSLLCENYFPLTWNGVLFDSSDTHQVQIFTTHGADSTLIMQVVQLHNTFSSYADTIVENQLPYSFHYATIGSDSFDGDNLVSPRFSRLDTTIVIANAAGCDSVISYSLYIHWNVSASADSTICENFLPLQWNGVVFDSFDFNLHNPNIAFFNSKIKIDTLLAYTGADSVLTMTLYVNSTYDLHYYDTICSNQSSLFNDTSYHLPGTYLHNLSTIHSCDSNETLHLTVFGTSVATVSDTIVENQLPYTFNAILFDTALFASTTYLTPRFASLDSTIIVVNRWGCDSTINYTLNVHWNVSATADSTVCENLLPLQWNSVSFETSDFNLHNINLAIQNSTFKIDTLIAYTGADSVLTMTLTVDTNTHRHYYDTIVENQLPFTFNGVQYGILDFSLLDTNFVNQHSQFISDTIVISNAKGCDSVIFYTLHVNWNKTTNLDSILCENMLPLVWNGVTFSRDSVHFSNIDPQTALLIDTAVYTAAEGQDSLVVMHLTVQSNTSATLYDTVVENQLPHLWNGIAFNWNDTILVETRYVSLSHSNTIVNAAGCDSVAAMNVHVWRNCIAQVDSNVCQNDFPFLWNGVNFDSTASDSVLLSTTHGADSLLTMHVTMLFNTFASWSDTIVENQLPFLFNGYAFLPAHFSDTSMYSGDSSLFLPHFSYLDTLVVTTNVNGCDSLIDYRLYVHWNVHVQRDSTVCADLLPLQWNNRLFTDSIVDASPLVGRQHQAMLFDTLPAASGADSIIAMYLHVNPTYAAHWGDTVCDGESLVFYGDTLAISGLYERHFFTTDGCDSSEYLHFENYPNYDFTYYDTICDYSGVMRMGVEYIGVSHMHSIHTCDSNETYHLWGLPVSYSSVDTIISDHQLPFLYEGYTFSDTANAQMQLVLINQYGCDSIVNFTLTVMPTVRVTVDSTICEGLLPLLWDGTLFDTSDFNLHNTNFEIQNTKIVIDTLHTRFGADSIVTRNLHVNPEYYLTYVDTTCNGAPYSFGDSLYNVSGNYVHHYFTVNNCDSVETLRLQVNAMSYATQHDTIVENQLPYTFGGVTFIDIHPVVDTVITILNTVACDSVITYSLFVLPNSHSQKDTSICFDQLPLHWDGLLFESSDFNFQSYPSVATKPVVLPMPDGTDSIIAHTVVVRPIYNFTDTVRICNSYQWIDGNTYTESIVVNGFRLFSVDGCDSVKNLILTVDHSVILPDSVHACGSYLWIDGNIYSGSVSGVTHTLSTVHGCDSTRVLYLTVSQPAAISLFDTICKGVQYEFGGRFYSETGIYVDSLLTVDNCDSVVTLNLHVLVPYPVDIKEEYDCDTRIYTLTALTDAPYFEWNSIPEDRTLNGQFYNRVVEVLPTTHELYILSADYADVPTCPSSDSIYLSPLLKPHAVIEYTPEFLSFDQLRLSVTNHSTNELTHRWYINDQDYGDAIRVSYLADPATDDSVVVRLIAEYEQCKDSAIVVVPFRKATIWVPNAFTPDESSNNLFFVRYMGIVDYSIDIYTRGGILVWHSEDINDTWDGTYQGLPCPQDAYVWIVHYRDQTAPNNLLSQKGTVVLLR